MEPVSYTLTVKGKISNVRWLEQAPWNARKVKSGQYFNYVLTIPASMSHAEYQDLHDRIDGGEHGPATGCWIVETANYNRAAVEAEERAERARIDAEPLHPAWAGIAAHLTSKGRKATNETCADFAAAQVEVLQRRHRYGATAQRLAKIALDLAWIDRAGDVWAAERDWLKTL